MTYNLEFVSYLYSRLCVTVVWGEIQFDNDDDDARFVIHQHIYKTLHRKLNIEKHEPQDKPGVTSCVLQG